MSPHVCAAVACLVLAAAAGAQDTASYTLNVTWTLYPGLCSQWHDGRGLACDELDTDGRDGGVSPLVAWIVVNGVPDTEGFGSPGGIGGVQFGIEYGQDVQVLSWAICTGGSEIPQAGWPASGTGDALTWGGGCFDAEGRPDGSAPVLFLVVDPESEGLIQLTGDPRIDMALAADCSTSLFELCAEQLGSGHTTDGAEGDVNTCGNLCEATPAVESSWGAIKSLF